MRRHTKKKRFSSGTVQRGRGTWIEIYIKIVCWTQFVVQGFYFWNFPPVFWRLLVLLLLLLCIMWGLFGFVAYSARDIHRCEYSKKPINFTKVLAWNRTKWATNRHQSLRNRMVRLLCVMHPPGICTMAKTFALNNVQPSINAIL